MSLLMLLLTFGYLAFLAAENARALRDRRQISHVVYVNGTRGKSTVSRLIDAGLRAGGYRVFCKTTGSLAMTIDVDGGERPLSGMEEPISRSSSGFSASPPRRRQRFWLPNAWRLIPRSSIFRSIG